MWATWHKLKQLQNQEGVPVLRSFGQGPRPGRDCQHGLNQAAIASLHSKAGRSGQIQDLWGCSPSKRFSLVPRISSHQTLAMLVPILAQLSKLIPGQRSLAIAGSSLTGFESRPLRLPIEDPQKPKKRYRPPDQTKRVTDCSPEPGNIWCAKNRSNEGRIRACPRPCEMVQDACQGRKASSGNHCYASCGRGFNT